MTTIIQNILLGISIAAPVGPASLAIINRGMKGGFSSAIQVALGVVTADVAYVMVAYFGLAKFITIPLVKISILIFGMLVLTRLSYRTIQDAFSAPEKSAAAPPTDQKNRFLEGFAVNISNPVAVVWWLGMIGSILATSDQQAQTVKTLFFTLTIVVGIFLWHTNLSVLSHFGKKFLNRNVLRVISLISAVVLFIFALRFGYLALLLVRG